MQLAHTPPEGRVKGEQNDETEVSHSGKPMPLVTEEDHQNASQNTACPHTASLAVGHSALSEDATF